MFILRHDFAFPLLVLDYMCSLRTSGSRGRGRTFDIYATNDAKFSLFFFFARFARDSFLNQVFCQNHAKA